MCRYCYAIFWTRDSYLRHREERNCEPEEKEVCHLCGKTFGAEYMKKHLQVSLVKKM